MRQAAAVRAQLGRLRRGVARRGGGAPPTAPRVPVRQRLELELEGTVLRITGRLRETHRVTGLVARWGPAGDESQVRVACVPSSDFDVELDLASTDLVPADARSVALFLDTRTADDPSRELRLGRAVQIVRRGTDVGVPVAGSRRWVHLTAKSTVSIVLADVSPSQHKVDSFSLTVAEGHAQVKADLASSDQPFAAVTLQLRNRRTGVQVAMPLDPVADIERERATGHWVVSATGTIPVERCRDVVQDAEQIDVVLAVAHPSEAEPVDVPVPESALGEMAPELVVVDGARVHVLSTYVTFRVKRLALSVQTYDADAHALLTRLRRVAWALWLVRPWARVWLVGETGGRADDNGYHFFAWVRAHHPRRRVYFVTDAGSEGHARVAPLGQVVVRGSRRHVWLALVASRYLYTHGVGELLAGRADWVVKRSRGRRVFLQHGVTAMKNVTRHYGRRPAQGLASDVVIACSPLERRIFVEDYLYAPHQVAVTGFARFDALLADPPEPDRLLLVMPTWRDWLRSADDPTTTDYVRQWHDVLDHPHLRRQLEERGTRVVLVLHPNASIVADQLVAEGVEVRVAGTFDLQELLRRATVLLTDYSSVAWDAAFLRRPVGFFQFDQARMLVGARGPHIDLETQLPGPVLRSADETASWVAAALESGAGMAPQMVDRADRFLQHRDTGACGRIYDVVRRRARWRDRVWRFRADHRASYDRFRAGPHYVRLARAVFGLAARLPRRDLVVFESDRGARYGDSPRAIFEHLQARGSTAELVYVSYTPVRLAEGPGRKVGRFTLEYFWLLGRARYWVTNQNLPELVETPRGTTYVQTWNGTPLKKMQHDVERMAGRGDDYHEKAAHLTRQWDVLVSPSPYASACFESAFRFEGRMLETGYPRNDALVGADAQERRALVRRRLGVAEDRLLVLYAPTFRDDQRVGAYWRQDLEIDLDRWREELGATATLAVRFHNLVRERPSLQEHADVALDVSRYPDTQELLLASDVLVTDYSSVMFDYSILARPMVFLASDLDHYQRELRGFYLDLEVEAPGPVVRSGEALLEVLRDVPGLRTAWAERLAQFRATYAPWDDGAAASRVVDHVMSDVLAD